MRRAIAAAVTGGLVLGGAVATPSYAAVPSAGKALAASKTMKTVVYKGYQFQVPTDWPVYRLDEHPQTCVRYDVHAVYLGTPGPDMECPAGLIGRTQTVSFLPGPGSGTGSAARSSGQPQDNGGTDLQRLSAVHSTITQNAVQHELSVGLGPAASSATVLGTYGADPAVVKQVLNTLQLAPADAVQSPQSAPAPVPNASSTPATSTRWPGLPAHWPIEIVQQPSQPVPTAEPTVEPTAGPTIQPTAGPTVAPTVKPTAEPTAEPVPKPTLSHPVGGFDTCTAPSLATMNAWRSDYAAVGVYIGGANAACAAGNLSAGWIRSVASKGWGVLPAYVGAQAPCWGGSGDLINPATAATQGEAAGADAVKQAKAFGLGAGSPIYYDMEAYNGNASCSNAVLAFLGSWDRRVAAAGYVTGVYSSQDSGIADMQQAAAGRSLGFTPPDAVWIALWDNSPTLSDGDLAWPLSDRAKQYSGGVNATVGGITLNIDKDIIGGPVAH
jgi:hypothetical protein